MFFKVIATCFLLFAWATAVRNLREVFVWKQLNFEGFPNNDGQVPLDASPIDVDVQYMRDGSMRVFTTIPRFQKGIPFTLGTVSNETGTNGPLVYPYPSYEWHNISNTQCTGITSAFRVAIDECNHMWIIDSGSDAGDQICPPQLLTFDLNTDKLINRFQFTSDLYTPIASVFITPAVDIRDPPPSGQCQKAMVYVADVGYHGLVVYDSHKQSAWRIENKLMYPDPDWGTHTIAEQSFDLMDGIFAVSLTPRNIKAYDERCLFFHALASETENSVLLHLIDNQTIWQNNLEAMPEAFEKLGNRGVQSAMEAMDSNGNLFAGTNDPLSIFAWDITTPYIDNSFQIVADNEVQLQFISGMKVVKHPHGYEELWVLTCRFQKLATETLNSEEWNFRIMKCKIDDLLRGKGCCN